MKKLKLNLDDLKVESFETVPESLAAKGTVKGADDHTVPGYNTCNLTCQGLPTCDYGPTCLGTCPSACTCGSGCFGSCITCGGNWTCWQTGGCPTCNYWCEETYQC